MKTSIKVKLLSTEHFSESDFLSKDFPKAITKISNYRHLIYFGFLTETYNLYSCMDFWSRIGNGGVSRENYIKMKVLCNRYVCLGILRET